MTDALAKTPWHLWLVGVIIEFLHNLNWTEGVTMLIVTHMLPIVLNLATS